MIFIIVIIQFSLFQSPESEFGHTRLIVTLHTWRFPIKPTETILKAGFWCIIIIYVLTSTFFWQHPNPVEEASKCDCSANHLELPRKWLLDLSSGAIISPPEPHAASAIDGLLKRNAWNVAAGYLEKLSLDLKSFYTKRKMRSAW